MTWLPANKYERIVIEGATGPGTMVAGTYWKFVNHSTEGPPGSIDGTVALFKSKPSYCPHLMIDPLGSGRRIQHINLEYSACALKGGQGGWQTNRARAIQMEIVGYARDAGGWPDDALWQIADVIADVIGAGYPIDLDNVPDATALRGTLATSYAPQRFSGPAWHDFDGLASHVYVPFNDHWDAGTLDARKVAAMAKQILDGTGRTVVPRPPLGPLPHAPSSPGAGLLIKGMTGGAIVHLQELLVGLGYALGVTGTDGVFGIITELAVRRFQGDHGLVADGIVGPATSAALSAAYIAFHPGVPPIPPPASPASGTPAWPGRYLVLTSPYMSGGDIRTWQTQMLARGWHIDVDGVYGEQSYGIAKTFQHDKGLTVDGIVGPQSWSAAWTAAVT